MFEMIREVSEGRWFRDPSPFRCIVEPGHPRLCVITGPNASGKSLVRKILSARYREAGLEYIHTSQEHRSSSHGLGRLMVYGTEEDDSTGYNSVKTLLKSLQAGRLRSSPFGLMLDEPEIGCSEETAAGIGLRIARDLESMTHLHGLYVITHSRDLVRNILQHVCPTHWRLAEDGPSLGEWASRPVAPTEDLEGLVDLGRRRWAAVQGILNARH